MYKCLFIGHCCGAIKSHNALFRSICLIYSRIELEYSQRSYYLIYIHHPLVSLMILSYSISIAFRIEDDLTERPIARFTFSFCNIECMAFPTLNDSCINGLQWIASKLLCRLSNLVARSRLAIFNRNYLVIECLLSQHEEINRFLVLKRHAIVCDSSNNVYAIINSQLDDCRVWRYY